MKRSAFAAILAVAVSIVGLGSGCPGAKSDTYAVGFNFHLVGMNGSQADAQYRVDAMLAAIRPLYKKVKFEVDSVNIYFHNGPNADRLTHIDPNLDNNGDGWPDGMEELLTWSAQTPDKNIDIFFFRSIGDEGILGIAGGIPGPTAKGTPYSGVLLNAFGDFFTMSQAELTLQATTIVHEGGLYHTTERNGLNFDSLSDTPQCPQWIYDYNGDGLVSPTECFNQDGPYLMFWASGKYAQDTISDKQVEEWKNHGLVRKK
jgi:hypothetical protein